MTKFHVMTSPHTKWYTVKAQHIDAAADEVFKTAEEAGKKVIDIDCISDHITLALLGKKPVAIVEDGWEHALADDCFQT